MTDLRLHVLLPALLAVCGLAYVYHLAVAAAPVQIAVEGARVQFEPGVVRVRVRVVPHAVNRGVTVAAISEGFTRSSYEQLDGLQAPITRWIEWRDIPAGEYDVIAHLSPTGAEDRTTVSVLGRGF